MSCVSLNKIFQLCTFSTWVSNISHIDMITVDFRRLKKHGIDQFIVAGSRQHLLC